MMHRPQEHHADLGLLNDDQTEDLRKRKAVVATTARRETPTQKGNPNDQFGRVRRPR